MSDIDFTRHCPICGSLRLLIDPKIPQLWCSAGCLNPECYFAANPGHFRQLQELRAREALLDAYANEVYDLSTHCYDDEAFMARVKTARGEAQAYLERCLAALKARGDG